MVVFDKFWVLNLFLVKIGLCSLRGMLKFFEFFVWKGGEVKGFKGFFCRDWWFWEIVIGRGVGIGVEVFYKGNVEKSWVLVMLFFVDLDRGDYVLVILCILY